MEAKTLVREHCMCAKFEDIGTHFRVVYPDGYYPNGAQAHKGSGQLVALNRLLEVMERHWKESIL